MNACSCSRYFFVRGVNSKSIHRIPNPESRVPNPGSDIPDTFPVIERNLAVFAHLEHRTEPARRHRGRRPCTFNDPALLQLLGWWMSQDCAGGKETALAIDHDRAVQRGERRENAWIQVCGR